ncbi:MAG: bifunctional serine/threonine-protein kinase/formylglycine-generating enzyme family protein [Pyrinomonadaceae bacterium]
MHTITGEPVLEGKYHLECRLGQGGMGVVYKARHAFLKTQLAIKIILPDLVGNDPQLVTRFRQEALAAAAIRHQNVVGVTDYGVIQGQIPFLVMEYVDGESLHDLLTREKVLSPERALELMSAICAGVGAAHHQGIVHRDLKPLNIMICSDKPSMSQAVKILDFGLAKIKSGELLGSFIQAQTTGLMGSPYYMAPEQWADDEPDSRSDIYSLGVMLFQMLTGDVPFKGSSIPAIMKKHISDPPPTFAELNMPLSIELEQAVRHTLHKDKEKRTASVEHMIAELKTAIEPAPIGIHTTSGAGALPTAAINIRTTPPRSKVFIDNVPVGESREDGWITLNGIQSGNHYLRVSHDGFEDWQTDVNCDGRPQQVIAELRSGAGKIPMPAAPTVAFNVNQSHNTPHNFSSTQDNQADLQKTSVQVWDTGNQDVAVQSIPPRKNSFFSPLVLGAIALIALLGLGGVGLGGAYFAGLFGRSGSGDTKGSPTPLAATPTPDAPPVEIKAEMVEIPGGQFQMGRDGGDPKSAPAHPVNVQPFFMDKAEVTDREYLAFVIETNHVAPKHWTGGRPVAGTEMMPVRYVSVEDAEAFAAWRSKRDGVKYRLPTESEWEYAARNGPKNNLFPWGDEFSLAATVMAVVDAEPARVGSKPQGNNIWGVSDLMGNVWELTSSELILYPGSDLVPVKRPPGRSVVVRGGSANEDPVNSALKIDSTFRTDVLATKKDKTMGFRLVRSQ